MSISIPKTFVFPFAGVDTTQGGKHGTHLGTPSSVTPVNSVDTHIIVTGGSVDAEGSSDVVSNYDDNSSSIKSTERTNLLEEYTSDSPTEKGESESLDKLLVLEEKHTDISSAINKPSRLNDRLTSVEFLETIEHQTLSSVFEDEEDTRNEVPVLLSVDSYSESSIVLPDSTSIASNINNFHNAESLKNDLLKDKFVVTKKVKPSIEVNVIPTQENSSLEKVDSWKLPSPIVNNNPIVEIISLPYDDIKSDFENTDDSKRVTTTERTENDFVVETIISTVLVDPVATTVHHGERSRFQRSIDSNLVPSEDYDASHLTTYMSVEGRSANRLKKNGRRSDPEPDIDDIIQGIMKLLGGNVKIDSETNTRLTTFAGGQPISSTRTNDRGPPRLPLNPFNFFNGKPSRTRPPIRRPITSPVGSRPIPGRPTFVANTLPPFYATLPPELDRPRPQLPSEGSTLQAFPLPVNFIPESATESHTPTPILPSPTSTIDLVSNSPSSTLTNSEDADEITSTTITLSSVEGEEDIQATDSASTTPSLHEPESEESISHLAENDVSLEPSLGVSNSSIANENTYSTSIHTSDTITSMDISSNERHSQSTEYIASISSFTTLTETVDRIRDSSRFSSEIITVSPEVSSSLTKFRTPSIVDTSTVASSPSTSRYHPTLPSSPTSPPPFGADKILRPTPPYKHQGVVLNEGGYRPGQVFGQHGRPGEVFDVTVSAHQGFGGAISPVRPFQHDVQVPNYGSDHFINEGM